mmetsp:Transcript_20424/g.58328  ORF Transcript_20424/g.58328 Transcript_20424/m.58328 type:complete len:241 (-) Transcript_20424:4227-4949(-)
MPGPPTAIPFGSASCNRMSSSVRGRRRRARKSRKDNCPPLAPEDGYPPDEPSLAMFSVGLSPPCGGRLLMARPTRIAAAADRIAGELVRTRPLLLRPEDGRQSVPPCIPGESWPATAMPEVPPALAHGQTGGRERGVEYRPSQWIDLRAASPVECKLAVMPGSKDDGTAAASQHPLGRIWSEAEEGDPAGTLHCKRAMKLSKSSGSAAANAAKSSHVKGVATSELASTTLSVSAAACKLC